MAVTAGVGPRGTGRSGATCVVAGCRCDRADLAPFADTQVRQLTHLLSETDILVVVPLIVRTKLCILHANCASAQSRKLFCTWRFRGRRLPP